MITKLNKEQKKNMEIYQKKWYNTYHSLEFDEEKANTFIDFLYTDILKKDKPVKIILDSPMSCQLAINMLKNSKLKKILCIRILKKFKLITICIQSSMI